MVRMVRSFFSFTDLMGILMPVSVTMVMPINMMVAQHYIQVITIGNNRNIVSAGKSITSRCDILQPH